MTQNQEIKAFTKAEVEQILFIMTLTRFDDFDDFDDVIVLSTCHEILEMLRMRINRNHHMIVLWIDNQWYYVSTIIPRKTCGNIFILFDFLMDFIICRHGRSNTDITLIV